VYGAAGGSTISQDQNRIFELPFKTPL